MEDNLRSKIDSLPDTSQKLDRKVGFGSEYSFVKNKFLVDINKIKNI